MTPCRPLPLLAALAAASTFLAAPARAQIGAIGAAPGGAVSAADAAAQAPVFGQSAVTMPRGTISGSAVIGVTGGSFPFGLTSVDFTVTQLLVGAFFAPTDRALIGATFFPYFGWEVRSGGVSEEVSGRGDAALFGKYQFWLSESGSTSIAGIAQLGLPLADDGFGANGTVISLGGAFSHALGRTSLHAALSVLIPSDDMDGNPSSLFTGGVVYAASPALSVAAELIGTSTTDAFDDTYSSVELAPGVRWRVGNSIWLNGGLQVNVSTSAAVAPYDYALMLGIAISR